MPTQGKHHVTSNGRRIAALVAGPCLSIALFLAPAPAGVSAEAWAVTAITALMIIWWMTEAVPLATTALLPVVLFPIVGVMDIKSTTASYAHPLIFLFLGGFMLARAMERWQLHKRIAFYALRLAGGQPDRLILSVMCVTAFLSMWVSNTATAMMMLPIGQSIVAHLTGHMKGGYERDSENFSAALMLGIAYAATIGGMGTLIGTPPNALFAGFMSEAYSVKVGFAQWMLVGVPVVIVLLPVTWLTLARLIFRFSIPENPAGEEIAMAEESEAAPLSRGEILVAIVMSLTALAWVLAPLISKLFPFLALSDSGIAILAAVLLFIVPVDLSKRRFLLSWDEAIQLRWDVLILFGGGLALASAMTESGLVSAIASAMSIFATYPLVLLVPAVMIVVVYLGELASNTAMAAIFLPIAGAFAIGVGADPMVLALPVALAASLGFMLPVATPPNAIIFGSGAVTGHQMLKAGALLDVVSIVIVAVVVSTIGAAVFGLTGG